MYIKFQRKDLLPVLSLCQNFISHYDSRAFPFLTPAWTFTLVATAKICIELPDCRTGPDPLAAGRGVRTPRDLLWRGGARFLGWLGVLCSRLAGSAPKSLHTPPPCNECSSTWSRVIRGSDLLRAQELDSSALHGMSSSISQRVEYDRVTSPTPRKGLEHQIQARRIRVVSWSGPESCAAP